MDASMPLMQVNERSYSPIEEDGSRVMSHLRVEGDECISQTGSRSSSRSAVTAEQRRMFNSGRNVATTVSNADSARPLSPSSTRPSLQQTLSSTNQCRDISSQGDSNSLHDSSRFSDNAELMKTCTMSLLLNETQPHHEHATAISHHHDVVVNALQSVAIPTAAAACYGRSSTRKPLLVRSASERLFTVGDSATSTIHAIMPSTTTTTIEQQQPQRSSSLFRPRSHHGSHSNPTNTGSTQLTKRGHLYRRLSDAFLFWLRLETFLLLICSVAIGLLVYYEFWFGSFLTYPFYRAVSPFELQSYVREMEQFMGSSDVERINVLLRSRHVSHSDAEEFFEFLWQPEFCDIRFRHCATQLQPGVKTPISHNWVKMLRQPQRAAWQQDQPRDQIPFSNFSANEKQQISVSFYNAVLIGHQSANNINNKKHATTTSQQPSIVGISNIVAARRSSAVIPNINNRRAFLCLRCACHQSTTQAAGGGDGISASVPSVSAQPPPPPPLSALSAAEKRQVAAAAVPASSAVVSSDDLFGSVSLNNRNSSSSSDGSSSSSSNNMESAAVFGGDDSYQSPSTQSASAAATPSNAAVHNDIAAEHAVFSAGTRATASILPSSSSNSDTIDQSSASGSSSSSSSEFRLSDTTLFHASVYTSTVNRVHSDAAATSSSVGSSGGDRQFCFLWPQFPPDLYMYNTAQLGASAAGGNANDDADDYWLDANGNVKMLAGVFETNRVYADAGGIKVRTFNDDRRPVAGDDSSSSFSLANATVFNISMVHWSRYWLRWKCSERTLHIILQNWRENVFMPWREWLFHVQCNPLYMVFAKFFQIPFDLAIHWILKLIFFSFLLKLIGNAMLFAVLDPHCRVSWRQRIHFITYPISIPLNVAVSFSLVVTTYFVRECWDWSDMDAVAHPLLDQVVNLIPAVSLVYFVLAIFWVSTMAARQNPTQGWWFCVNIRKFMMKGPKELTSFFLTVVNIRGGNDEDETQKELRASCVRHLDDDDLLCLICHEPLERDVLVRDACDFPVLECRHIYHSSCLTEWLIVAKSEKCPYCQEKVRLSKETLRRLYPRTRQFRVVVWLVANISHRVSCAVYSAVARAVCAAFRDCCIVCRIWLAFFSYFLAVFVLLLLARRVSFFNYDLHVQQNMKEYVRRVCY